MPHWISLPTEIVFNIFRQFENKSVRMPDSHRVKKILMPTADLLQLQLTCKSWSPIARSILYKRIKPRDIFVLDKLISTLINSDAGVLIENMYIDLRIQPELLNLSISTVAKYCLNLKVFSTCSFARKTAKERAKIEKKYSRYSSFGSSDFWYIIERERARGFLTKLEAIAPLDRNSDLNSFKEMYYSATFQLRQTLRELETYNMKSALSEEERLLCFPNVDTIRFHITQYVDVYTIDRRIKNILSIKSVNIHYDDSYSRIETIFDDTNSDTTINGSSHVKRLCVTSSAYTYQFYRYIMQAFPSLEAIFLSHIYGRRQEIFLSPTEAALLFHYFLINIREVDVAFNISGNPNDAMLLLHDKNNTIRHLNLKCNSRETSSDNYSYLTMSTNAQIRDKVRIKVYSFGSSSITLPRSGLIEKSGFNLVRLKIDMCLTHTYMELIQQRQNEIDRNSYSSLSDILYHCPNLRDFSIYNTYLYDFGDILELEQEKRNYQKVIFKYVMFDPLFLSDLSRCISHISDLHIIGCSFVGLLQPYKYRMDIEVSLIDIKMPDTKFDNITYTTGREVNKLYLILLKTGDDQPTYYYGKKGRLEECTSSSERPLFKKDKYIELVYIHCQDVRKITLDVCKVLYHLDF